MKKLFAIFLSVTMIGAVLTGCSEKEEQNLSKITVSEVTHSIFYAAQYVALNEGYFEQEGLEVELINAGGADKVMTSVLTGSADIGLAGAETCVYVHAQGKEDAPQVFAQLTNCDGSFLVGREKNDDFDWQSLKGSTILPGRKGGMPYMTLLYALNKNGLEVGKDVFFNDTIQFNAMTGAFLSGEGDYVTVFEPSATDMEINEKGYIMASVGEEAGKVPYTTYFAKKDYDTKILQKFTNAIKKGQEFVDEKSPQEIAKAIQPSFPDTDLEVITKVVERYKDIHAYSYSPVMEKEDYEHIIEIIKNAKELQENIVIAFDDVINNTYAEKAK